MDIRMPRMDGLEATRRIVQQNAQTTRVLVLTTFSHNQYVYEALRAGASGFLLKDSPPEELLAAVEIVARGDALLAPAVTRAVVEEFVRRPPPPEQPPARLEQLTPRETEVLQLLARGHANAEIAKELYVTEATVRTHVAHVLQKLDLRDRVQAVIYAYETGLVQPGSLMSE
jgi:DNA-binding NarL/FixJ family response regulator